MPPRTIFLSRLIGLYMLLVAVAMLVNPRSSVLAINGLANSGPLIYLSGAIAIFAGVAMILSHNIWSGGAATILVTLTGWLALFKGILLLCLPPQAVAAIFGNFHYDPIFYIVCAVPLILGLFLIWSGFRS